VIRVLSFRRCVPLTMCRVAKPPHACLRRPAVVRAAEPPHVRPSSVTVISTGHG
jgi:hypothetical protein